MVSSTVEHYFYLFLSPYYWYSLFGVFPPFSIVAVFVSPEPESKSLCWINKTWIWTPSAGMDGSAELRLRGLHQRPVCWRPKQRHPAAGWGPAGGGCQALLLPGAGQAVPVQPLPAQRHLPGGLEPLRLWLLRHRLPGTLLWERWAPTGVDYTRLDVWQDVKRISVVKRWVEPQVSKRRPMQKYRKEVAVYHLACRNRQSRLQKY